MARKATKAQATPEEIPESTWMKVHRTYLSDAAPLDGEECVQLRELARRFAVPFSEAKRRALVERWELERKWRVAQVWYASHGLRAKTEDQFCTLFAEKTYGRFHGDNLNLMERGEEGRRVAFAEGREIWRRIMGPAFQYEAVVELDRAQEAFMASTILLNRLKQGPVAR